MNPMTQDIVDIVHHDLYKVFIEAFLNEFFEDFACAEFDEEGADEIRKFGERLKKYCALYIDGLTNHYIETFYEHMKIGGMLAYETEKLGK